LKQLELPAALRTRRLLLRRWSATDLAPLARINADPEVTRYLGGGGRPLSEQETEALLASFLEHWQEWGYGYWALERLDAARLIGFLGLGHHRWYPGEVEIGWRLERAAWNQGLATEGAAAVLDQAFTRLELDHVIAVIHRDNAASRRVAEKSGLRVDRHETRIDEETGRELPILVYRMDRSGPQVR
jgi:RimJ/RimL family protein N-acetyltransferase